MRVEGKGLAAPCPIEIRVSDGTLRMLKERAVEQAIYRDYRNQRTAWGQGLSRDLKIKNSRDLRGDEASVFIGNIGEYGLCDHVNQRFKRTVAKMDMENRKLGDGGTDVEIFGLRIQVKTRTWTEPPVGLIRRAFSSGIEIQLPVPAFVFCRYLRDSPNVVSLVGWQWKKDMLHYPLRPAWRGDHFNIEVPDQDLLPMGRLIRELRQREASERWL